MLHGILTFPAIGLYLSAELFDPSLELKRAVNCEVGVFDDENGEDFVSEFVIISYWQKYIVLARIPERETIIKII